MISSTKTCVILGEKVAHLPTVFDFKNEKSYCITKLRSLGKHNLSDLHILKYSKSHCSILLISLKWSCT